MEWFLLALAIVLTAGTGLFVIAEFSLITLDRPMVEDAVRRGETGSKQLLRGVKTLSTQLSSAQVGITLTTLLTGYLMEPSLGKLLATPLAAIGVPGPSGVALTIAIIAATVFSMLIGELVPKNLAITSPLGAGRHVAPFQLTFTVVFKPLVNLLNGTANLVLRWMGLSPQEENSSGRAPQELVALVRRSAEAGTLDEQTATLLTRSLAFSERTAADVMTPRTQVYSVRKSTTAAELVTIARRTGFSRFPVVGSSRDDIIGVVHLKTAIAVPHANRHQAYIGSLMRPAVQLPETVRLDPLLLELRGQGLQMAVVADEFGGTAGVVTLEDVVEELVGEVADEHDRSRSGARRTIDGSWMMPGLLRPDEARRESGADIPEDAAYETLGGYLMTELGRVPVVGDQVELPSGVLRVERMHRRRVDRVRFTPDAATAPDAATDEANGAGEHRPDEARPATRPPGSAPATEREAGDPDE